MTTCITTIVPPVHVIHNNNDTCDCGQTKNTQICPVCKMYPERCTCEEPTEVG